MVYDYKYRLSGFFKAKPMHIFNHVFKVKLGQAVVLL